MNERKYWSNPLTAIRHFNENALLNPGRTFALLLWIWFSIRCDAFAFNLTKSQFQSVNKSFSVWHQMFSDQNQIAFKYQWIFNFRCYEQWFLQNVKPTTSMANKQQTNRRSTLMFECKMYGYSDTSLHKRAECLFEFENHDYPPFYCGVFFLCRPNVWNDVRNVFQLENAWS